jgi:HNH endonuclease
MTPVPKKTRIVDFKALDKIRKLPCEVCRKRPPSHPHHIRTRGSGGPDTEENLIALCPEHHTMIHQLGTQKFLAKHPHLRSVKKKWD